MNIIKFSLKSYGLYLRLEYYFISYISYFYNYIKSSNYKKRFKYISNLATLRTKLINKKNKRLAIFVAFHSSNEIPESNLNYLKIIKKSFFNIIYVHNGPLEKKAKKALIDQGCFIICRENIGQDFGAWKDTICFLEEYKLLNKLDWLLLCNDSNFCFGGKNGLEFKNKFKDTLNIRNKKFDFISLNCNYEGLFHYQSYFLCLSNKIITKAEFKNFWQKYIPLNNRYHAIKKGEIKFSNKILKKFRPKVLLTSHELCKSMQKELTNGYESISNFLPQNLYFLETCFNLYDSKKSKNIAQGISRLINSLESYNPSHVFGILNIIYLKSPFLKKDVTRMGVFSINQVHELLSTPTLNIKDNLKNEIIKLLINQGTPNSYLGSRRIAVKKGIPVFKELYEYLPISKSLKYLYNSKKNKKH